MAQSHTSGAKTITAGELSERLTIPVDYTQQVLQRLRKGGIIESVRGPTGGYRLQRESSKISLKELLHATEGATFEVICESRPLTENCSNTSNPCSLRDIWFNLRSHVDTYLEGISLEQLAKSTTPTAERLIAISSPSTQGSASAL